MSMQSDYQKEQAEKTAKLRALTAAIAKHLEGFRPDGREDLGHMGQMTHPDGRCINLFMRGYGADAGRAEVTGDYPKDRQGSYQGPREWGVIGYKEDLPRISVNASRDPEAIAKDIARRFLPEYSRLYAACLVKKTEREEYRDDKKQQAEQILAALGKKRPAEIVGEPDNTHVDLRYNDDGYGELTASSVKLNSLPFSVVLKIAALLGETGTFGGGKKGGR